MQFSKWSELPPEEIIDILADNISVKIDTKSPKKSKGGSKSSSLNASGSKRQKPSLSADKQIPDGGALAAG